jgi:hypothetical protein
MRLSDHRRDAKEPIETGDTQDSDLEVTRTA